MRFRAPAAGVQVGRGHVRVDARRALVKLREYQLANPVDWVLEAIRAGIASGATSLSLDGDANDVWLSWEGPVWPLDDIPDLLSELVSPATTDPSRRLLARAVNSALGARAEFCDVLAISKDATHRFRFTPESFADTGATMSQATDTVGPGLAPQRGMLVHVRRRLGFDVLHNALRGEPPELERVRQACWSHQVPIRIRNVPLPEPESRHLLRVELGQGLQGYVALCHPEWCGADKGLPLSLAEHGVVLETRQVDVFPDASELTTIAQPLAAYVNVEQLPSNASRSKVREDTHPMTTAMDALDSALTALMETLCAKIEEAPETLALRSAALLLLARYAGGPNWPSSLWALPDALQQVANLPLLRNAIGESRPVRSRWQAQSPHLGRSPYPEEFSPWMADIPWIPKGDPAVHLYGEGEPQGDHFKSLARRARRGLKRQRSFLKQGLSRPALEDTSDYLLWGEMGTLCADSTIGPYREQLARISGQVGLSRSRRRSTAHLLFDGREIEDVELTSAVPFTAVLEFAELVPRPDYRAVERNDAFDYLYRALLLQLVAHVECLLKAKDGELAQGIQVDSRGVMQADAEFWTGWALSVLSKASLSPVAGSPLARQPHFTDIEGRRHSLDDLRTHARVAVTSAGHPESRPAFLLIRGSLQGMDDLAILVGPETELVFYPPEALKKPASRRASLLAQMGASNTALAVLEPATLLESSGRPVPGAIAWSSGAASILHVQHLTMNLMDRPLTSLATPCEVLVRADFLRPLFLSPEKTDLEGLDALDYHPWHDELFWASCQHLARCAGTEGDAPGHADQALTVGTDLDGLADRVLLASQEVIVRDDDGQLKSAVADVPLFATTLGRRSAADLAQSGAESFHYFQPGSLETFDAMNLGWEALVLTDEGASAAAALLQRPVVEGQRELTRRTDARDFEQRHRQHRKGPEVTAQGLFGSAAARAPLPYVEFSCLGSTVRAWPGQRGATLAVTIILEGRLLCELSEFFPLPIEAVVTGDLNMLDSRFELRDAFLQQLHRTVEDHSEDLILKACDDERALGNSTPVQQFLKAFLTLNPENQVLLDLIRKSIRFHTVRGETSNLEECCRSGVLMTGRHSGPWLEGDSPHHVVDAPILRVSDPEDSELAALLMTLSPNTSDTTDAIFAVQAQRRVEQGLVGRPSLEGRDVTSVSDFQDLSLRDFGVGQIGLCNDECEPFLLLYADGELQSEISNWSRLPIAIAIDNPALRRHVIEEGALTGHWRQPLERASIEYLSQIGDEVAARLLATADTPLEASIRHLLLAGHQLPARLSELPLFPCLHRPKRSWSELVNLSAEAIWYVPARVDHRPLDENRVVLVLNEAEIPSHPRLHLHQATEELREDEAARANQSRAPLRDLELPSAIAREAMARSTGTQLREPLSDIAVLRAPALRGVDVIHEGRLLCTLPDPCPWPTVAVASASAFQLPINRTLDGVEPGAELDTLLDIVRRESRRLLQDHFAPPEDRLASSFYLASATSQGAIEELSLSAPRLSSSFRIVAGRLWLSGAPRAHGLLVTQANGTERRVPNPTVKGSPVLLPIEGVLQLSSPGASLSQEEIDNIAVVAYRKLVRNMSASWSETSRDERHEAHVKLALSLGMLAPQSVKAPSLAHEGKSISPEEYARLSVHPRSFDGFLNDSPPSSSAPTSDLTEHEPPTPPPIEEEASTPAETALASWLRIQLHDLHLSPYFERLTLEDSQREVVIFDQGWLRLGAASPFIHELSALAESGSEDTLPLFDLLLHVACLLEDGAPMFSAAMLESTIGKTLMNAAKPEG